MLRCFLLLLVVLLQQGKGGDMASAFGGGGSQTASARAPEQPCSTRASSILGALFMVGAIVLGILGQRGPGALIQGVGSPAAPQQQQQKKRIGPAFIKKKKMLKRPTLHIAKVAELADAPARGAGVRKNVGVRIPPFAPTLGA